MPEVAFLNGEFMPIDEATVPIEDRGLQFADGVYEVVATYGGQPYAMPAHLQRLERSLAELRIELDIRNYSLEGVIAEAIRRSGYADAMVYIQITRGVASRHHEFPHPPVTPTVIVTVKALEHIPSEIYEAGVEVISYPDLRWKRCDIKSISLLANVLAKQQAKQAGAYEAILVDEEGRVTEGSSTSVFCVRDGVLKVPPSGPHILPSITRAVLLDVAGQTGISVAEGFYGLEDLKSSDEVMLAGTTAEALGVIQVDDVVVGSGRPGPVTQSLREEFRKTIK